MRRFSLFSTFLALVCIGWIPSVHAVLLCDNGCNLVIEFSGDSSIEAVEALTISFGDGGLIDTGVSSTAYVNGDSYTMNAGETLNFNAGGKLNLGQGGNIEYSVMNLNIVGSSTISDAAGGTVNLYSDSSWSTQGDTSFSSDFSNAGSLKITGGAITIGNVNAIHNSGEIFVDLNNLPGLTASIDGTTSGNGKVFIDIAEIPPVNQPASATFAGNGNWSSLPSSGSVTIFSSANIPDTTPISAGVVTVNSGAITLNGNAMPQISLVNDSFLISQSGSISLINGASIEATLGVLELSMLSAENLPDYQGVVFPTADGSSCTVENNRCHAEDGSEYQLENGEFVRSEREQPAEPATDQSESASSSGGGAFGLLLFSVLLLFWFRRYLIVATA